jgi:hypothetical protein
MRRAGVVISAALIFSLLLLTATVMPVPSGKSNFVFGSYGKTIKVNQTLNETVRDVLKEVRVSNLAPPISMPGWNLLYTVTYKGVSYSIFSSGNDTYIVLWDSKGIKGKEKAELVLVKEKKGQRVLQKAEDNSSLIIYGFVGRTYLIKSKLIPMPLQNYNYIHDGEAYAEWYYPVGSWKATNHAKGRWYILYGVAITGAYDLSYEDHAVGVTCCKTNHYITGVGTVASQVRHDTHHMLCVWNYLGILSRHCDMYAWYSVDVWLNTDWDAHGSDNGAFGCSCP